MREENSNEIIKCHDIITSEEYIDIYHRVSIDSDIEAVAKEVNAECPQHVLEDYVLFHIKMDQEDCEEFYFNSEFSLLPNLFGLTSTSSIEAAGIGPVLNSKALNISGNGVLVGIIDTGIDYRHEAFIYENGTSKILSIWDQTIGGNPPEGFLYGSEYTNEVINKAINSEDSLSIVPSIDEIGHGTFMAGLSTGRPNRKEAFQGAAPDAELIIVKLKQAKKCLKDFLFVKEDAVAYQTSDIYQGIDYVFQKSKELDRPIVILLTLASSDGAHDGTFELEEMLAEYGKFNGVATVLAAGNEANSAHHYHGVFKENQDKIDVQLNVAENEKGVYLNMWCPLPDIVTIELISPSGNTTGKIPFKSGKWNKTNFPIESSIVNVLYQYTVERTEEENISILIKDPLPGLWTIVVYSALIIRGEFDIYLPINEFIHKNTIFMSPNPNETIVIPGTNTGNITVGGYNEVINSLYLPSGRGYTRVGRIKPDIVAPCVNVIGPYPRNTYGTMSGTSVGAAITAGASALLLEWGLLRGNEPFLNTIGIKNYLARGARRRKGIKYPNREWGYGELDLINTFKII
ncbi:S8 family peptidase [Vallitalea okinawensis]|uniref:S8 family peptidase n=1 Tax=Vallitalea okinawensis TaxID=2078660 RepID=UPI001478D5A1|nr:S8 family peptidase [Vallitalea okinawensis]